MVFFPIVIAFVIFLNFSLKLNHKDGEFKNIIDEPSENVQPISFITPNINDFSFIQTPNVFINNSLPTLTNLSYKKMVLPNPNIKNIDIEEDISLISSYEENYMNYIYLLNSCSKALFKNDYFSYCKTLLEECISCNSNTSITYKLYYDLLCAENKKYTYDQFINLRIFEHSFINTNKDCKLIIKNYIQSL